MSPELCDQHSGIKTDIDNLKDSDNKQWQHITAIETALPKLVPIWLAIVLTIMGTITGSALTFAAMILKFATS